MWKDNLQRLFRYRKINPSPALWEQLDAQLAQNETRKTQQKNRKIWYYGVVASLLCLCTGYLLQQKGSIIPVIQQNIAINTPLSVQKNNQETSLPDFDKTENTISKNLKEPLLSAPQKNINAEVDSLLGNIKADELLASVLSDLEKTSAKAHNKEEVALLKDLEKLSPQELLLIASTELNLEKYVETQYNADKLLSDTEKEMFKDRVQKVLDKIVNKFNEARLALE